VRLFSHPLEPAAHSQPARELASFTITQAQIQSGRK